LTDRLAREGVRVWGRPVGIEPAAYACLAEHDFPGDDVELNAVVQCLVSSCEHDTVHLADLGRVGTLAGVQQALRAI
jgi:transcriptional regulator of acetoin/glycerol metabolism